MPMSPAAAHLAPNPIERMIGEATAMIARVKSMIAPTRATASIAVMTTRALAPTMAKDRVVKAPAVTQPAMQGGLVAADVAEDATVGVAAEAVAPAVRARWTRSSRRSRRSAPAK
jgi:hypothetical protein